MTTVDKSVAWDAATTIPPKALKEIAALQEENATLREALKEVVKISDRKHEAWDRAKAALKDKTPAQENGNAIKE